MGLKPRPGILKIPAAYAQGQSELDGVQNPLKLSANESEFGPSPKAIEAYRAESGRLHRYPDGSQSTLREALGHVHGIDPARIVCGNGSDELILLLTRAFVGPGDEVLISECGFEMCRIHALAQGADVVVAPEKEYLADVDAILSKVSDKTRLVPIANPNNPTGTYLPAAELERLHAGLPDHTMLLIDGAYAEYVTANDYDSGIKLVSGTDNVVMTRTFSKIYGLSGLRIGWAYCPGDVIDIVQRIRTPFNTNRAALAAAVAALQDEDYTARVRAHNAASIERMSEELTDIGIQVVPSVANFILMIFPDPARSADDAARYLQSQGIIPRPVNAGGPANCLRITIGLEEHNEAVLRALREAIRRA